MSALRKRVAVVGMIPELIDFSKFPGATPEKIHAGLQAQMKLLEEAGYEATLLLVDKGETAEQVLAAACEATPFDCVEIGAGLRNSPEFLELFEKVINLFHRKSPQAAICFNTSPADTLAAIQRWV